MPDYTVLNQMYDHHLDPVRGWWELRSLTKVVSVDPEGDAFIYNGMVGYKHTNGKFRAGMPVTGHYMPLFCRTTESDHDVNRVEGNIAAQRSPFGPRNPAEFTSPVNTPKNIGLQTLVGTGGFELGTTEFKAADNADFAPNVWLTSEINSHADAGLLKPVAQVTGTPKTYVGMVSDGVSNNKHGKPMLYFWTAPHWLA